MARKGDDSDVWRLSWEKTPSGTYAAWVVAKPRVRVEAITPEELEPLLHKQIERKLQVGEYMVDWAPPLPTSPGEPFWRSDYWVQLHGQIMYYYFGDPKRYWTKGYCSRCGNARGARSARPLDVYIEQGGTMAFCGNSAGPRWGLLIRSDTAKLLGTTVLPRSAIRKVNRLGRGTIEFLEVCPPEPIPWANLKSRVAEGLFPRRCSDCGMRQCSAFEVYPARAVPEFGSHLWVEGAFGPDLCVPADWWRRNRRKPEFAGVTSEPFLICDQHEVSTSTRHKPLWKQRNLEKKIIDEQRRRATTYRVKLPEA